MACIVFYLVKFYPSPCFLPKALLFSFPLIIYLGYFCRVLIRLRVIFVAIASINQLRVCFSLIVFKGEAYFLGHSAEGSWEGRGAAGGVLASERSPVGGCMWEVIQPSLLSHRQADITSAQRFLQPVPQTFFFFLAGMVHVSHHWLLVPLGVGAEDHRDASPPQAVNITLEGSGLWGLQGFTLTATLYWPRCPHPGQSVWHYCGWCGGYFHWQLELSHGAQVFG